MKATLRFVFILCLSTLSFVSNAQSQNTDLKQIASSKIICYETENTSNYALIDTKNSVSEALGHTFQLSSKNASNAKTSENTFKIFNDFVPLSLKNSNFLFFSKGIFYGFVILLILMNFLNVLLFNDKLFMKFAFWLSSLMCLLFVSEEGASLISNHNVSIAYGLSFIVSCGMFMWFGWHYLPLQTKFKNQKNVLIGSFLFGSILLLTALLTNSEILAKLATTVLFASSIFLIVLGAFFWKRTYVKLFVIASFLPFVFALDFFLLKNWNISLQLSSGFLKWTIVAELLLFTYALIFRMNALKAQDSNTKDEISIFLRNQEVMSRENITKMMDEIYLENIIVHYNLDSLEIKLLQYISEGKTNAFIAEKFNISEAKVFVLTEMLYNKLEIKQQIKQDEELLENQPDYLYN